MQDQPDLRRLWRILIKWWWVFLLFLVAGVVIAGALRYLDNRSRIPLYQSTAKLLIEGGQGSSVATSGDTQASQQVAQYYDEAVRTRPFLSLMAQKLDVPPGEIADTISIRRPRTFIEITATHRDPAQAAKIANATAKTLIEDLRSRQLTQIAQIQASLSQYGIVQDPAITGAQVGRLSNLSIAEEALEPVAPVNKGGGMDRAAALGGVLGLLVGLGIVVLREQLDDKVKSLDELKVLTGLTPLGAVMREPDRNGDGPAIYADEDPISPQAESYNFLRTSLEFASLGTTDYARARHPLSVRPQDGQSPRRSDPRNRPAGEERGPRRHRGAHQGARSVRLTRASGPLHTTGMGTLLVTSSSPGEGKSTTAANLATSFARSGKSVILVDSDLRRPSLHHLFKLQGHKGLTDVLLGRATLDDAIAPTSVQGLRMVPAGPVPPDPTYVLRAPKMRDVVNQLRGRADLVIFDSPPLLVVSDPLLLVPLADTVLLVVDSHSTARDVLKRGVEALVSAKPKMAGVVLNKVSIRGGHGYSYYQYSGYYTSVSANGNRGQRRQRVWSRLLGKGKSWRREHREVKPEATPGR